MMKQRLLILMLSLSSVSLFSQVGIGTDTPNPSAILDITSDSKGVLFPHVTLESNTDEATVLNPVLGLIVYNTGNHIAFKVAGYLFWNGGEWMLLNQARAVDPVITDLNGTGAILTPQTYTKDVAYAGNLRVPYTGGNGGSYGGGAIFTGSNNLVFELLAGTLSNGGGYADYKVSGKPSNSSPNTGEVEVSLLGEKAPVTYGSSANADITTRSYIGRMTEAAVEYRLETYKKTNSTPGGLYNYDTTVLSTDVIYATGAMFLATTPDGKYQIGVHVPQGVTLENTNIVLRHTDKDQSLIKNVILLSRYDWSQVNNLSTGVEQANYNEKSSALQSWSQLKVDGILTRNGDKYVYNSGRPEFHQVIFTDEEPDEKTIYRVTIFFSAKSLDYGKFADSKVWIHLEEINAN